MWCLESGHAELANLVSFSTGCKIGMVYVKEMERCVSPFSTL